MVFCWDFSSQLSISTLLALATQIIKEAFDRLDQDANQIVIKLENKNEVDSFVERLRASELSNQGKIESFEEDIPKFIIDVRDTFTLLSLIFGVVGICVSSITIFIIIFINALSRKKQIGILKGIGISRKTIQAAYVTQAFLYSLAGSILGILVTWYVLVPYTLNNPIDFPFTDVVVRVGVSELLQQASILILVSCVAGYIPVWMIARKNTLDSILNKN